jgi:hypothetical protein
MNNDHAASLWMNHSNLLWSRLQTASVIEGGALTAAYAIHDLHKYWAALLLIVAMLLLLAVLFLMMRDTQYMDAFKNAKDDPSIIPTPPTDKPIWDACKIPGYDIRRIQGRHVGFFIMVLLIVVNFIAALLFI